MNNELRIMNSEVDIAPKRPAHSQLKIKSSLFIIIFLLFALPLLAQESNRAALVVRMGDGDVQTACVTFEEESISGYDLLQQSGLPLAIEASGMGTAVCSINNTGCPASDCFCSCKGSDCTYWSYWHSTDGEWLYADGGATIATITNGDVDGWSWGPGSLTDAIPPPDMTFADICAAPSDVPSAAESANSSTIKAAPYAIFLLMIGGLFVGRWLIERRT